MPALRKGDRTFCLARDCDVIVTGWTDHRIPWPRCRALGTHGGGSGLLVDEELARAIRTESATAIKYWWGASTTSVWAWRKALGIGRADTPGSRRLIQAASQAGAEVLRLNGLTDEQTDAMARRAIENNQGRFLKTGYHGPLRTPEQLVLLGTEPDDALAARFGRTVNGVRLMRTRLGIPTACDRRKV